MNHKEIHIRGARQHNLKNVDISIPRDRLTVITGLSGSGKSSLAFDTLYAEGQRRYVESLSTYARQFVGQLDRPDVDSIEGLSPAIAIDQRSLGRNPRSTVGTATEIYDFLRVLFARVGKPFCPRCGRETAATTVQQMKERLLAMTGARVHLYGPVVRGEKGTHRRRIQQLARHGFIRARVDGRLLELTEEIRLSREERHSIEVLVDRLEIHPQVGGRLAESLETAAKVAGGVVKVEREGAEPLWFSEMPFCLACGVRSPEITPKLFSFNDPSGACSACKGLGMRPRFDPSLVVSDPGRSLRGGAIALRSHGLPARMLTDLETIGKRLGLDVDRPFGELPEEARRFVLSGSSEEYPAPAGKRAPTERKRFEGVIPWLERMYAKTADPAARSSLERFMRQEPCPECGGTRLGPQSRAVRVGPFTIAELCAAPISRLFHLLDTVGVPGTLGEAAEEILRTVRQRLAFLDSLGVAYLSLDRSSETLSGGEAQRIRLATQLGSTLVGVLYVLDEPTVGLHPGDQTRLLETLGRIRDGGNTVVVVEHDAETILAADYVVDMGPGAGELGGRVVYAGPVEGLAASASSLTGAYLSGRRRIPIPSGRRATGGSAIQVLGASEHNLRQIDARFPLGCLTCVSGPSGSGKSSLVLDTLFQASARWLRREGGEVCRVREIRGLEALNKVIAMDQSPIGRTPRSNPATYAGIFQHVRELFAQLPESRVRGYQAGRYSFNVKGGRCEACQGDGVRRIEMLFLPDVHATCGDCRGTRYNEETLEIRYKGMNIAEILGLTVNEALRLFESIPRISTVLQVFQEVGLGYLRLGQPATTLSGGEAQRLKLARELCRPQTGRTLYILDEPTTGLHFDDVRRLLEVLQRLVNAGNTVVVIEHNLQVIKCADYVIDLGPGGGEAGGRVVACGTPEEVAGTEGSATGSFLKKVLEADK